MSIEHVAFTAYFVIAATDGTIQHASMFQIGHLINSLPVKKITVVPPVLMQDLTSTGSPGPI